MCCDVESLAELRVIESLGMKLKLENEDCQYNDGKPFKRNTYFLGNNRVENLLRNSAWLYDVDHRDHLTDDIQFYTDYAKSLNCDSILELGCGTGRVALALAKEGFNVTGLDLSNEMLDVFRQKLDNADDKVDKVKSKIEIIHGNMARFDLNKKFDLIIVPFRAFQCLTDDKDIANSLDCVKNHLTDGGIFIVNVFNPRPDLTDWCSPETVQIQWERLDENTGNYVIKKYSQDKIDTDNRIMYITFIYEVKDKAGNISEITDKLKLKYYYENQLQSAVEKAGLKIKEKFGWYDKTGVDEAKRELIFVCGK
jgi:SAM-dependent methyltransferase